MEPTMAPASASRPPRRRSLAASVSGGVGEVTATRRVAAAVTSSAAVATLLVSAGTASLAAVAAAAGGQEGSDSGHIEFDIDLSSVTVPPLWEPLLEEYFPTQRGGERDEDGLAAPVLLTSPTWEEFAYHARRGYPLVVTDWGTGMAYDGWTCRDFAQSFPFGYMKAEYIDSMKGFDPKKHDIKIIDGERRFNLGSFKPDGKTMWHNFTRPASARYADDPRKPVTGPYVWHVKDELSPKEQQVVQSRFEAPGFMQDGLNKRKMNRSFEVWFSPGAGSGAGAHNDGYCESVVSLQLRGDKKWRMMLEPEMTFLHSYDEFDGGVYQAGHWQPDLAFLNSRGAAVIWPPGYLHETKTAPPPDGECGTALTLQYAFPQPVKFLRAFLPRLSLSAEVGQCVARAWSGYPTLFVPGIGPSPKQRDMEAQLTQILSAIDSDGDKSVSLDELRGFFAKPKASTVHQEKAAFAKEDWDLFLEFKAQDTVAYHDANDDGSISKQELWDSLVQWNVVLVRINQGLKLVNRADRQGLEAFERSLDRFRRAPIPPPKRLRPELEALFSLPKGTKVLKSLKGIHSFSDSEFFEQARDRIEALQRKLGKRREEM